MQKSERQIGMGCLGREKAVGADRVGNHLEPTMQAMTLHGFLQIARNGGDGEGLGNHPGGQEPAEKAAIFAVGRVVSTPVLGEDEGQAWEMKLLCQDLPPRRIDMQMHDFGFAPARTQFPDPPPGGAKVPPDVEDAQGANRDRERSIVYADRQADLIACHLDFIGVTAEARIGGDIQHGQIDQGRHSLGMAAYKNAVHWVEPVGIPPTWPEKYFNLDLIGHLKLIRHVEIFLQKNTCWGFLVEWEKAMNNRD